MLNHLRWADGDTAGGGDGFSTVTSSEEDGSVSGTLLRIRAMRLASMRLIR
jgi:hypothetical protein